MAKNKIQHIFPPEGGWKAQTVYLVEASFNEYNPIHGYLFFTGFLTGGQPAGYNELHQPGMGEYHSIDEVFYMRAIREVMSIKELQNVFNAHKLVKSLNLEPADKNEQSHENII